jgi:cold shock protein
MAYGTVKWFDVGKGYGFIAADNAQDVYVHYTAIRADSYPVLREGQRVEFEIVQDDRGLYADAVRIWPDTDESRGPAGTLPRPVSPAGGGAVPGHLVAHLLAMWEPAVCAFVAADFGDVRASAALDRYLRSWEDSTDWASLAGVLARIKAGDRYDPNLLAGLDQIDRIIAARVLDALAGKVTVPVALGPAMKFGTLLADLVFAAAHEDQRMAESARRNLRIMADSDSPVLAAVLTRILDGNRNPDLVSVVQEPLDREVVKTVLHFIPLAEAEDPRKRSW